MKSSQRYFWSVTIGVVTSLVALSLSGAPGGGAPSSPRTNPATGQSSETTKPRIVGAYGKLPLSFEANRGQADSRVKFLSRGSGYTLFLTPTEAVLSLSKSVSSKPLERFPMGPSRKGLIATRPAKPAVLRMKLVGANPATPVTGLDELPGKSNYFIGNDPKKWRINVPNYGRVKVHDVYPGVDLMYYGNQRQLEEDFVVAPGADPRAITMAIAGAEKVSIDAQGELVLATEEGETRLQKPMVYQEVDGTRREIAGGYVLKGRYRVGFELEAYDTSRPLVIDPVLVYSTYLGGSGYDTGEGIAVDSSGNAYVTGLACSTNFPTTPSAFQTARSGLFCNAFVTKLNAAGSVLTYSTYLGGTPPCCLGDQGFGIAVDSSGNAYVTGIATSNDFPTTPGAFQTAGNNGYGGPFVTKLNAAGNALVYSTYLGGSGDAGFGIAVDSSGNSYVTGLSTSSNFPTVNPIQAVNAGFATGFGNAFVAKLSAAGSALVYSTYLGGTGNQNTCCDAGYGIAVDSSGNAYVAGDTVSTDFPTMNPYQAANGTASQFQPYLNAFVAKLNAAGNALVYSTYLGGSNGDEGFGIAVDSSGNAYVTGIATSNDFPTTPGAFQTAFIGPTNFGDVFVTKLNAAGNALVYSTYLGGMSSGGPEGYIGSAIAVDSSGNAYVTGNTCSTNFPTVSPIQPALAGGAGSCPSNAFVSKLNAAGNALVYSTYLGGSGSVGGGNDRGVSITLDSADNAYVVGRTGSTNFPTMNPIQAALAGVGPFYSADAFVAKIGPQDNTPAGTVQVPLTSAVTVNFQSVTFSGTTGLTTTNSAPAPPAGFSVGSPARYYDISTTATFSGSITVCINYSGITFTGGPQLFHFEGGQWVNVTTSVDTVNQIVCGSVTSLSPFGVFSAPYMATVQPPIKADGSSVFKASRGVVPVKFTLTVGGTPTCNLPLATISLTRTGGTAPGPIDQSVYFLASDSGTNFRIDTTDCQYIYNLATGSLGIGTYLVNISIGGSVVGGGTFGLQ